MILITGATSGIGEATARALHARKKPLLLVGRRGERLEQLARDLPGVRTWCVDVRDRAALTKLFERDRPELVALVNNAGLALGRGPLQDGNLEDWDTMLDTNVRALLSVTKLALPALTRARGHIVNIGSVAGHLVYPGGNVYCATKHAVRALNQALRADLLGTGVRVTEISPGMVETEFSQVRFQGDTEKARAVYAGMTPLKAEDVAEAVVWSLERPTHVNIEEIVLYPTDQASPTQIHRQR